MRRARFTAHGVLAIDASSWGLDFPLVNDGVERAPFKECGSFAVVEITGPLMQRATPGLFPCWDSYEAIRTRVDAALESAQPALLLRIDSPGGEVAGCFELSEEIRSKAAAKGKRVVAYVDGMAASAAYALACAAERIYVPSTGIVGSIGTIKVAVDQTRMDRAMGLTFTVASSGKRKADGNPHVPTSEESVAAMQAEVDAMAAVFFDLVARARELPPAKIAGLEASMLLGAAAVVAGLADEVTTFEGLLAKGAAVTKSTNAQPGAEEEMDEKEKAIAALKALAASDDKDESNAAKAALKAMGVAEGDEGEEKPKDDDKDESKSKAEGGDGEEKPKDDDKDESKSKASVSGDPALALAAKVQSLEAWKAQQEDQKERAKLMAQRPDFAPEVVALMNRSPLSVVRDAVKNLPRGAAKSSGQVAAARAALTVQATIGDSQGEATSALPENEAHELDVQMGLARRANAIRHEGNRLVLGVMTPAEARAELAKKGAAR